MQEYLIITKDSFMDRIEQDNKTCAELFMAIIGSVAVDSSYDYYAVESVLNNY